MCHGSVHSSWNTFFKNVDAGLIPGQVCNGEGGCTPGHQLTISPCLQAFIAPPSVQPGVTPVAGGVSDAHAADIARVLHLIRAFQVRGHEVCNLDPLGIAPRKELPELDYKTYVRTQCARLSVCTAPLGCELDALRVCCVRFLLRVSPRKTWTRSST